MSRSDFTLSRREWLKLSAAGVYGRCETPATEIVLDRDAFARDPRIVAFDWTRGQGRQCPSCRGPRNTHSS